MVEDIHGSLGSGISATFLKMGLWQVEIALLTELDE
jgi:hypothetical protein